MSKSGKKVISSNKKAFHNYIISDKYVAGLVLTGTEIKSIRSGGVNLKDSFAKIEKGEAYIYNMLIRTYVHIVNVGFRNPSVSENFC